MENWFRIFAEKKLEFESYFLGASVGLSFVALSFAVWANKIARAAREEVAELAALVRQLVERERR
ncbi:MAG TPA: hypothetical protein QGH10_21800 [Armatimonadota bacterium]|nr:hypothetical protein [Armatimonadota bacterium]